jgi:EAL domain-containing protein (putative c-di-GMP-specific phosphodiesterase class I)/DNA-binding NarL/FixJ family response regulator
MAGVPVRVLIADNPQLAAAGTTAALDSGDGFELVGVAGSAAHAAELAEAERPDVALVSARVTGGGDDAVRGILSASPETHVLAHSGEADHSQVVSMLRAGAGGFLVRGAPPAKLMAALRAAADGDTIFDGTVNGAVLRELMDQVHAANRGREAMITKRARIRRVLERGEFEIVFQPIVALDSRETVGYEALSRFAAEPDRGPHEWFAEAHEVGLGPELELAAIKLACARSCDLPAGMFMAVNVSPVTTERPELLELLADCQVDEVVLEVTEHAAVEDYRRFRVAVARVRQLGARLAVDDAGAGFSSLRHILELDAELIKLDGSLTRSLEQDPRRRSLAAALIEFGRESGASVLAEHIESELQLNELRRLGVHYGQGFHLGRPQRLPAEAA